MTTPQDIAGLVARMDLEQFEGHTPGKWSVHSEWDVWCGPQENPNAPLVRPNMEYRRWGSEISHAQHCANARLMAASPDLLQYARDLKATVVAQAEELEAERAARGRTTKRVHEVEAVCTAWQEVFEGIEAHLQDRIAMDDPGNPERYLRIVQGDVARILPSSKQIVAARWAAYARHEAERDSLRARVAELEGALRECEEYFDNRSDVRDGSYGIPEPNVEMTMLTTVRTALKETRS